jgi:hypothetical protein
MHSQVYAINWNINNEIILNCVQGFCWSPKEKKKVNRTRSVSVSLVRWALGGGIHMLQTYIMHAILVYRFDIDSFIYWLKCKCK